VPAEDKYIQQAKHVNFIEDSRLGKYTTTNGAGIPEMEDLSILTTL